MLEYLIQLPCEYLGQNMLVFLELIDVIQFENAATSCKSQHLLKSILSYCPPIFCKTLLKLTDVCIFNWFNKRHCQVQVMKFDVETLCELDIKNCIVVNFELVLNSKITSENIQPLQNLVISQRVTSVEIQCDQDPAVMGDLFSLLCSSSVHSLKIRSSNLSQWMEHISQIGSGLRDLSILEWTRLKILNTITEYCPYLEKLSLFTVTGVSDGSTLKTIANNCPYIRTLEINIIFYNTNTEADADLTAFAEKCPQLEELSLNCEQLTDQCVIALAQHCSRLKKLKLYGFPISSSSLITLSKLGLPLEELGIPWFPIPNAEIAAQCAHALSRIRDLYFYYHEENIDEFIYALQHMTGLRGLYLSSSNDQQMLPHLLRVLLLQGHCASVESITIGSKSNITLSQFCELLRQCPQLQRLELFDHTDFTGLILVELARNCPQLQEITLNNIEVTEQCMLVLATHCRQLRYVYIPRGLISVETVEKVVMYCRHLTDLHVCGHINGRNRYVDYSRKEIIMMRERYIESSGVEVITHYSSNTCCLLM